MPFEVRDIETNDTWAVRPNMGRAMDSADAFHIGTGKHFCVVELRAVYHTQASTYDLRPSVKVLSRGLKAGWERFAALRDKLPPVTRRG